jgi:hypothetical protein
MALEESLPGNRYMLLVRGPVSGMLLFLLGSIPSLGAEPSPDLRMVVETVIDAEGLNFSKGPWGTCINGQTFQEQAVATHQGYQYAHLLSQFRAARNRSPQAA